MRYPFTLPQFPDSTLEIETSIWTGRPTIWKDGVKLGRSVERGKPFLAEAASGEVYKIYPKQSFAAPLPALEIDGIKYDVRKKLAWYENVVALLPVLLVFIGGGLGGGIGVVATVQNLKIFQTNDNALVKYAKVIGVSLLSYLLYILITYLIVKFFG